MNILNVGTAQGYVKSMALNMKWKERKQDAGKAVGQSSDYYDQIKTQAESTRKGNKINAIENKLLSGSRLSQEELDYLRENSPEQYEKAVKVQKEREEYRKKLEQCRSKEDVEKLNQHQMSKFSAEAKSIENNPNIPKAKKLELMKFLTMRMAGVMGEDTDFKKTPQYNVLPDKTEKKGQSIESVIPDEAEENEARLKDIINALSGEPEPPLADLAITPESVDVSAIDKASPVEVTAPTPAGGAPTHVPHTYTANGTHAPASVMVSGSTISISA